MTIADARRLAARELERREELRAKLKTNDHLEPHHVANLLGPPPELAHYVSATFAAAGGHTAHLFTLTQVASQYGSARHIRRVALDLLRCADQLEPLPEIAP